MTTRVIPHKKHRIEIDTASLRLELAMPEPKAFGDAHRTRSAILANLR